MDVTNMADKMRKLPREPSELQTADWITNQYAYEQFSDSIYLQTNSDKFCVKCFYIVRLQNMRTDNVDAYIRFIATQDDENGGSGFSSYLTIGKPSTLKLK